MKTILKISVIASLMIITPNIVADDSVKTADNIQEMFANGDVSGQIRLGYYSNNPKVSGENTTYATAIGGQLKFETAAFYGLSAGIALYTSQSIMALSGDQDLNDATKNKFNSFLSSDEKNYTEMAEAYINYEYNGFNFRAGRQLIDTPLADSDDLAMTPNTFEAYIASYTFDDLGLTFIAGNIQRMQGVDTDYENVTAGSWMDAGDSATNMLAALYANDMIEAGIWYYDIGKLTKAVYADATASFELANDSSISVGAQYLKESEKNNSDVEGSIAGVMAEGSSVGLTAILAYDRVFVKSGNSINQGFGGGSSYTNMQSMTAGALHEGDHGDGSSYVASLGYEVLGVNLSAAYGDFKADAINGGGKGHVSEIDLGLEYEYNDGEADLSIFYVISEDKESSPKTQFDFSSLQVTLNYNF